MVSIRLILTGAVLTLAVLATVIQAQENCQRTYRSYTYYWYRYGTWGTRYSRRVSEYYCRYQKTPTTLPDGALRLGSKFISSSGYVRGRVEIWYSGSWGTICNRGWSSSDGTVVCQQMGYAGRDYRGLIYSISGGTGSVHAQYLYCSSSYEWITQCFSSWGSTCGHSQDVGVYCENKVRVQLQSGSNALQGRAFYWRSSSLRRICDDGFTSNDARVICRQLGFGSLVTYYSDANNYATQRQFGWSYSRSYWLWRLACDGTELFLHHCRNGGWSPSCYGYEDVGVRCNMPTPDVTLTASSSSSISVAIEMIEALRYSARITGYKIRYLRSGSSWVTNTYSTSAHTYTRTYSNLDPYTRYYVQATVVISGISSDAWSTTRYVTTAEAISQPVRSLMLDVRSATSIYVSWNTPEQINGRLSAYIVEYESITPGIEHHVTTTVPSSRRYITLTGLQEHTTYSVAVRVRNGAGESENARETAKTQEAAPSGPPTGVQARTTSSDTMSVFWEPPQLIQQNGEITGYTPRYRVFGGSYMHADVAETTYHMEGLTPYTTYYISVAARTSAGTGVYSTEIRQRTAENVPTGPPQNVRITALTSEHLIVSYSAPPTSQQNGIILTYTVEWGESTQVTSDVDVPTGSGLFHRVTGATPYTVYYARVAASTSIGRGPFSDWGSARTLEAAPTSPPRDVLVPVGNITSTSFQVTWSPPETGANGVIIAYTVVHGLMSNGLPIGTAEVTGQEYTVTSLRPFTDFYVSVAAKTSAGEGPFSQQQHVKTLSDVPGARVTGVSLTPDPSAPNIEITWTPLPTEFYNHAELTGYVIYYVASDPEAPPGNVVVGPTVTRYTLTGLHQRVAYTIEIAAENAHGPGPRSLEQTAITSGQAPDSAPFDLRAWLLDAYSIHLEWTAPRSPAGNLDILHYIVAYEQAGSSNRTEVQIDASTSTDQNYEYDITNLQPYREYIMTVYSVNEVDRSPGSTPYTTRTASAASPVAPTIIASSIFITSTSVRLVWNQISDDDARGVVIGYNFRYGLQNGDLQTISVAGHVESHEFPGLTPASNYQFAVSVHNVNGSGPYSDFAYVTTKDDLPSIPRQLRANATSPTSVHLTWVPPDPSNGAYMYLLNFTSLHEQIPDTDEIQLSSSLTEYLVEDLEEHVEYEFFLQAKTSAGIGEHAVVSETTLEAVPSSPPLNVTLEDINATAIRVSWEIPPIIHHNSPLTGYVIYYSDLTDPGGEAQVTILNSAVFTSVISKLEPYTLYDVQVAALNDAGTGPRSFEVTIETPKTTPPQPTIVDVRSPLSTQLNVTWTLPANPNGVLLGYTLRYEASYPPDIDSSGEELPGPDATYLVIVDLHPGTSYNIYLLARNDFNISDWEQGSGYTQSEVPTAAMAMALEPVTSTSIEVSWTPPNTTDWNGPLTEIIIIYGEGEDNSTEQERVIPIENMVDPDDMIGSIEIDELVPFTEYYFMMVLVNDVGEGPYTEEMRTVTLQDVPGPVENLTVEVEHTNITLTWDPPEVHNGILLEYIVYFDGEKYAEVRDDLIMVISNLEPRVQHIVGVAATTAAGEGESTSVQVQTADLPTVRPVAAVGAPSVVYYSLGGVIAIVVLAVIIVFLLGVVAYRRRQTVINNRAKGYAEDDWNLYDDYEDRTVFEGKEGFQVQENQLEHRPQGHAATDGKQKETKVKGSNISSALAGLRRINSKADEAYEDDLSAFDNALDRLRGMGDPFVVDDDEAPILY